MTKSNRYLLVITLLISATMLMVACTREAATGALPTDVPQGSGGGGEPEQQATNAAAMEQILAQGLTQTAQANPAGGGTPPAAGSTPTPLALQQSPTPAPTATLAATAVSTPNAPSSYTVQPGEWFYSIARKFNVDPKALIAANPQINPNAVLKPGTVINIPAGSVPVAGSSSTGQKTYVVKPGENLFRIALNNGTTHQTIAQLNGIPVPYTVYPGQVLKMP